MHARREGGLTFHGLNSPHICSFRANHYSHRFIVNL